MSEIRKCKQCGNVKSLSQYRKYINSESRYRYCLECEKINTRRKYLTKKPNITEAEQEELQQIEALYEAQRSVGLEPPRPNGGKGSIKDLISQQLADANAKKQHDIDISEETPSELLRWLHEELTAYSPEELESTMFKLSDKYRPQIRIDEDSRPIFDERFKDILNKIQDRFDNYEEEYYSHE